MSRNLAALLLASLLALALGACSRLPPLPLPPADGEVLFGAYVYEGVWRGMAPVLRLEEAIGRPFDVVHWFANWDDPWDAERVRLVSQGGRLPLISWEPYDRPLAAIAAGDHDAYLASWAGGVRAHAGAVFIRPFPEMNSDATEWSGDPAALTAAWRRVSSVFAAAGATNVRWVWSPNESDSPPTPENRLEAYYPGDELVDVLGLSGFNWGEANPELGWRAFEAIFAAPYARLAALGPQPIWVTETASSERGGDKAAWITGMLETLFERRPLSRLKAVVWFHQDKEADWRMDSSAAALEAFRAFFARSSP